MPLVWIDISRIIQKYGNKTKIAMMKPNIRNEQGTWIRSSQMNHNINNSAYLKIDNNLDLQETVTLIYFNAYL